MSQTISQILSKYGGFEKAFWASYSVNFTTLDFLLKKDFKQIMNPHYLHLICDGNQLDESISKIYDDRKDMSKLSKLQEYCTISPQFAAGSFHPKILLFASQDKLLIIVSSANATPSGILSNQDLIGLFYYDDDHFENNREICSLFQYLRSYDGWGEEAREDFNVIEESFDFLKEDIQSDRVLTIPNEDDLFSQIIKGLPDAKIQNINIFSPFFDDNYAAISKIADHFKVPVHIFSPQKEFHTVRKDSLPRNVQFYHSGTEINKSFHAKFYDFNCGNDSVVYWGSANCSYSGLLSPDRNYEFLIKCQMSKEEIHSLWGSLSNKKESSVEYGRQADQGSNKHHNHVIRIKKISTKDDGFAIQLDKPLVENASLKGIISNGSVVDFTIISVKGDVVHATCEESGLILLYVEEDKKRISNLTYINNPFAIQARVSGKQYTSDFDPQNIRDAKAVNLAFGYFNLKLPTPKINNPNPVLSRKGFWRLEQFKSRSRLSRIINLDSFIKQRVIKFKEKNDSENFPDDGKKKRSKSNSQPISIVKIITRETNKLLKNIILIVKEKKTDEIETSRWLHGIDILNYYILNYIDETNNVHLDIEEIINLMLNTSRISTWIICHLINNSEDHKERVELIRTIQDILIGVSIYRYLLTKRFSTAIHPTKKDIEHLVMIKRAIHLRHLNNEKFPGFTIVSEHSQLTYEDVLAKLSHLVIGKKTIEILNRKKIAKITGLNDIQVFTGKIGSLLFIKKSGIHMKLETILGEEKTFTTAAPLTLERIII